jgi:hypothetical protein
MINFLRTGGLLRPHRFSIRVCRKRVFITLAIAAAIILGGCGEDLEQQHYEPLSPLPLRVGGSGAVTPTPQSSPTPASTETPAALDEATPTEPVTTSTPAAATPSAPTPTPTPMPTPTPKPSHTPTPQASETSGRSARASSNTAAQTPPSAAPETAGGNDAEQEADTPIVTPYHLTIDKLMVCANVRNRMPVGCETRFSLADTGKVFTWMMVSGVKTPNAIKHVYYWNNEKVATVTLNLKYSAMRTWSQKTFKPDQVGDWKVAVMTSDDQVIAVRTWTVTP